MCIRDRLGAILIPGSLQLTKKDIVYRADAAKICTIVCVDDAFVIEQVELAMQETKTLKNRILVDEVRDGWLNFENEIAKQPDTFARVETHVKDTMLVYFTSGTTGMPKMVAHNFSYPLGHIVTAKYWQQVQENKLHMSVSDSGWAKFGWGKIYGQWPVSYTHLDVYKRQISLNTSLVFPPTVQSCNITFCRIIYFIIPTGCFP